MDWRYSRMRYLVIGLFCLGVGWLSYCTIRAYPGNPLFYIIFTLIFNILLITGFTKKKMFFDAFIGIFFWIGFWLKTSIRLAFLHGEFHEAIGNFDRTGVSWDHILFIASIGAAGFLAARYIRPIFFSYPVTMPESRHVMILPFYKKYRKRIIAGFAFAALLIACANAYLGIYQRGTVPRTILPFGMNGVFSWLLLFGMASMSAVMIDCELKLKTNPYLIAIVSLFECFVSNVSMLSRGMILNGSALVFGMFNAMKKYSLRTLIFKGIIVLILGALFGASILFVTYARNFTLSGERVERPSSASTHAAISKVTRDKVLVIDRWVGIEGVMAVASYPHLGWGLWKKAWQEKYSHTGTSLYDLTFIESPYLTPEKLRQHFISLPGIVAFFYYPGSQLFLFVSMFCLGIAAAVIEVFVYKMGGGNIVLCALIGEVVASRYAHFGYVPGQTYLLISSIILNMILIYSLSRILMRFGKPSISSLHPSM